jgi:hypothetical protein
VFRGRTGRIDIDRGGIDSFAIDLQSDAPAIEGPVLLRDVKLPTRASEVQGVRDFRAELLRIHNLEAAGHVHAAEQRLSRSELSGMDRVFSLLYDLGSGYGTETTNSALWFFLFATYNINLLFWFDGTELATRELVGWQEGLRGPPFSLSALLRAAHLTLDQVFSPLNVFGSSLLVVSKPLWITIVSALICLFATISLGLFLLALRRRFRLSG